VNGVRNWYHEPTLVIDFDGTVCVDTQREAPGPPRPGLIALLKRLEVAGFRIVIQTSRPPAHHSELAYWLHLHHVPYHQLTYGKVNGDVYMDDRGLLLPPAAQEEWVRLAPDDIDPVAEWVGGPVDTPFRAAMDNCAENPESTGDHAPGAVVVVPLTGGLDSTTAWAMACELELPRIAVYIDTGIPYAEEEIKTARLFAPDLSVITRPLAYKRTYQHIQGGRNAAILWTVAEAHRGQWGEIWVGNRGDETKLAAGDKSLRFHTTLQQLMTAAGFDFHLTHPLQGLSKMDLVRWWAERGRLDEALATRTCYQPDTSHCGACWACLQRVLAFGGAGFLDEVTATFPGGLKLDGPARDFWAKHDARVRSGQRVGRDATAYVIMARIGYGPDWWADDQPTTTVAPLSLEGPA
jgi:7-cyano-7-deazaguanine synthase in queuosine biosynthesis